MAGKLIKIDGSFDDDTRSSNKKYQWINRDAKDYLIKIQEQLELHVNYLMEVKITIEREQIIHGVDVAIEQYKYIDNCADEGHREAIRSNLLKFHNPRFIRSLELRNNLSNIGKYSGRIDLSLRRLLYLLQSLSKNNLTKTRADQSVVLLLMIKKS